MPPGSAFSCCCTSPSSGDVATKATPQTASGVSTCLARYVHPEHNGAQHTFDLLVSSGSIVDFAYNGEGPAAIVNAANEGCIGGGGVDGVVSVAGGPNLLADRMALKTMAGGVRCWTGGAVITGPGTYGKLKVPYVIHAVGPNYAKFDYNLEDGDKLLSSAYSESLERARENGLEAVAFSMLSGGVFKGRRGRRAILKIGMEAICAFDGFSELKEVHMCGFGSAETSQLQEIAAELGLKRVDAEFQSP